MKNPGQMRHIAYPAQFLLRKAHFVSLAANKVLNLFAQQTERRMFYDLLKLGAIG